VKPLKASKEQQLLFKLLKGDPPTSLEGIDTKELFDLFRRHRLFPLASPLLPLLETEEQKRWKTAIRTRTLRSMHLLTVQNQLIESFKGKGINAVPLKGPILAQLLYGSPGDRHSSDLDILIQNEKVERIIHITQESGFTLFTPRQGLSKSKWDYYSKHLKHFGLINRDQRVMVEIHTRLEDSLVLTSDDMEQLLKGMINIEVGGRSYSSMNINNTFLYLIIHGSTHLYKRLFWLRDISVAIAQWDLNHQKIISDAKTMKIERLLGLSLILVQEFFNTKIPSGYISFLEENKRDFRDLEQLSKRMILGREKPKWVVNIRQHIFNYKIRPEFAYKLKSIRESIHYLYIGKSLK